MTRQLRSLELPERQALVQALAEQVRQCETARRRSPQATISTGYPALDRLVPDGGLHCGTLVEWLPRDGGAATTLALAAARQACGENGTLVVVDRRRTFYPLAAAACGLDLSRLLLVRPQNDRDETWAIDQTLRSGGARAVLAWPDKLDDHLFRRLQLAAEAGDSLGLFVRPARAIAEPSWAEVRWLVEPLPSMPSGAGDASRRVQLTLLRAPSRAMINARKLALNLESGELEPQSALRAQRTPREARRIA
jgi:protein ImuA